MATPTLLPRARLGSALAAYEALAPFYDDFTADYPHEAWLGEIQAAAQEAMLRIWRHGRPDSPQAWLSAVVRNEVLRLMERRKRLPVPTDPGSICPTAGHGWEEDSIAAVAVAQLLTRLPPEDRALLWLRYLEDLTQPEVARRLGMPEGTVKVRLHRLRAQLREISEDDLL